VRHRAPATTLISPLSTSKSDPNSFFGIQPFRLPYFPRDFLSQLHGLRIKGCENKNPDQAL
jgi:hypothetical protein